MMVETNLFSTVIVTGPTNMCNMCSNNANTRSNRSAHARHGQFRSTFNNVLVFKLSLVLSAMLFLLLAGPP